MPVSRWIPMLLLLAWALGSSCARPSARRPFPVPRSDPGMPSGTAPPILIDDGESVRVPEGPDVRSVVVRGADGQPRTLYWRKASVSVGSPTRGSLDNGRALPKEGPGWVHRGARPYGTDETVLLLTWALAEVGRAFPGTAAIVIGDLSQDGGGRIRPHRSHQSGRDVDVGYYRADNQLTRGFEVVDDATLDAEKTWFLLERLLLTGLVQYVFIDRTLQALLFDAASDAGWPPEDLARLFHYPRTGHAGGAIIRHAPGHKNHFHIRFQCPSDDEECIP